MKSKLMVPERDEVPVCVLVFKAALSVCLKFNVINVTVESDRKSV